MIRLSSLALCATLITLPAFADEGSQPKPLDNPPVAIEAPAANSETAKSIDALLAKPAVKHHVKMAKAKTPYEGPDERRMDEEQQPAATSDPKSVTETRKLNGG